MSRRESESTSSTGQSWMKIELSHGQDKYSKEAEEDLDPDHSIARVDLHLRSNGESQSQGESQVKGQI